MIKKVEKLSTDYATHLYRIEKDYGTRTYSCQYRVDKDILYDQARSSCHDEFMQAFAAQATAEMDAQVLETIFAETGWTKLGRVQEDEHMAAWIHENVKHGHTRLKNGVYWFENKDEAAWFRLMFS